MCLAIAPDKKSNSGTINRLWRTISSTPMRLLSFCALIHALILGALFVNDMAAGRVPDLPAYLSGLSYGILALLVFGHQLTWLPKKYSQSPTHYGRYNSIYLLMMTGLGILEAGIFLGNSWPLIGMFLLVPAWLVALQGLRNVHIWINSGSQSWSRQLLWLLSVNFFLLILSIAGQHYQADLLTLLVISSSVLLLWPLILVTACVLFLSAPAKSRVIII